jgi:hypothetical protein
MSNQKFKPGDQIIWDRINWIILSADNGLYELKLVNPKQFTMRHGNGGYMDASEIDKNGKLVETQIKIGGVRRSRKNRRSVNRRRNSARHQ